MIKLILISSMLLLVSCGQNLKPKTLNALLKKCIKNGGVERIFSFPLKGYNVYCKDGAEFYVSGETQ